MQSRTTTIVSSRPVVRRCEMSSSDSSEKSLHFFDTLSRRQLAASALGLGGASVLAACDPDTAALQQPANAALAAFGANVAWVDSVLGAAPSAARTGDLASEDPTGFDGATAVVARGCITPGDGGGGLFIWKSDSTAPDDGGTIINPYGMTSPTLGRWLRIYEDDFNLRWFGAVGDGTTDDAVAVQNAINACVGGNRTITVPAGNFVVGTSLNLTAVGLRPGICFRGRGVYSRFIARCEDRALFDCTGNWSMRFERLWLYGDPDHMPAACFLFARPHDNGSSGLHVLLDVLTTGSWSKAAVVSISSEGCTYQRCDLGNRAPQAACVLVTEQNVSGIASYATFPSVFAGGNTVTRFSETRFILDSAAALDVTAASLVIEDARDVSIVSCFFTALRGRACIECRGTVTGLTITGSSAEGMGASAFLWLSPTCDLNASHIQMGSTGAQFYGEAGSMVRNTMLHAVFEAAIAIDVDKFQSNMVTALGLSFRARTSCIGNIFWGSTNAATTYAFPTNTRSNVYHDGVAGEDSNVRRTWHLADQHPLDRMRTNYIQANVFQDRVQNLGNRSGPIDIDLVLGSLVQTRLTGNATINFASGAVGVGGACTVEFEEGARSTLIVEQDSVGGRTLAYASNILAAWQPATRAGSRSSLTLVMDACGFWIPIASSNDL